VARAAVGYNEARGDVLEITSLPFERPDLTLGVEGPGPFAFNKNDILRFAEIGVLLVVGLALTFLVAAPLVRGVVSPMPALAVAGGALAGPAAQAALPPAGKQAQIAASPAHEALPAPDDEEGTIDIGAIDGKLKASTVRRVSEVVEAHPEESMTILRTWMHER
jgi:flagellar M-ring protein FliF